jgi:hypothetical protein
MGSVAYFVVIFEQGPRWDATRAMRDQVLQVATIEQWEVLLGSGDS